MTIGSRMFPRLLSRRFIFIVAIVLLITFFAFNSNNDSSNKLGQRSELRKGQPKQPNHQQLFDRHLLEQIISANKESRLLNAGQHASLTDDDLVIVVQVHSRANYLQLLIDSLAKVKGIENALVIFSHDLYNAHINSLVQSIQFCKVIQIFYPFSQQIWNNTFPGTSYNDCPKKISKAEAKSIGCIDADHPDTYGNYRESSVTQTKHHWFWKLNHVFEHLVYTKQHRGDFIFVEEDHYFSPDFLHFWKLMKQTKQENPSIDILTLGHYEKVRQFSHDSSRVRLLQWYSSKHNMGFTVDRALWKQIKNCSQEFCKFDDYNWDWSLMHIFRACVAHNIKTLVASVPRLYHIGACGIHHQGRKCDAEEVVNTIEQKFEQNQKVLFPAKLDLVAEKSFRKIRFKNNGGWADPRDHQLCQQYVQPFDKIIKSNPNFAQFASKF